MWIEFKEKGVCTFRNSDSITKIGDYSLLKNGLTVTFDDGGDKTIEIFFTTDQLDELYGQLHVRQNVRLIDAGYTPKAIRQKHKKAMKDFLNG